MKRLRCLADRVLIRPTAAPQKTGGLSVPEQQKEKPSEGVVVAAGPKALKTQRDYQNISTGKWASAEINPEGVSVGETVLYQKYAGREVESGGEKLRLIRLEEIDAVVEDGE